VGNDGWGALTCNEGINLVITAARGLGNDLYWPPAAGPSLVEVPTPPPLAPSTASGRPSDAWFVSDTLAHWGVLGGSVSALCGRDLHHPPPAISACLAHGRTLFFVKGCGGQWHGTEGRGGGDDGESGDDPGGPRRHPGARPGGAMAFGGMGTGLGARPSGVGHPIACPTKPPKCVSSTGAMI